MRIRVEELTDELSKVRGIGRYNQTLKEAIAEYGTGANLVLDNKNPDINLITSFNPYVKLKIAKDLPNVLVLHDLISLKYPEHFPVGLKGKLTWWQNKRIIKEITGIITDSEVVKQEIHRLLGVELSKIGVVPVATLSLFEKAKKTALNIPNLPPEFILYVGDITWNKNLPNLARAIKNLDFPLVLAGAALKKKENLNHPWLKSFKEFRSLVDNDPRFIFLGYVPDNDLLALYQQAKVVVLPSIDEGFGYPWLEASWQGTSTVVGRSPVTEEITKGAAVLVDPLQIESIVTGLKQAINLSTDNLLLRKQKERTVFFSQKEFIVKLGQTLYNLLHV